MKYWPDPAMTEKYRIELEKKGFPRSFAELYAYQSKRRVGAGRNYPEAVSATPFSKSKLSKSYNILASQF